MIIIIIIIITSSCFQVLKFLYQTFSDCTERTNYNWYLRNFCVS